MNMLKIAERRKVKKNRDICGHFLRKPSSGIFRGVPVQDWTRRALRGCRVWVLLKSKNEPNCEGTEVWLLVRGDNAFLLENWSFRSVEEKNLFVDMDISRWSLQVFPEVFDSRVQVCTQFITVLFLIDDMLDRMEHAEVAAIPIPICQNYYWLLTFKMQATKIIHTFQAQVRGEKDTTPADREMSVVLQLLDEMESCDTEKAHDVKTELLRFWDAQVAPSRDEKPTIDAYLSYRDVDAGIKLVTIFFTTCVCRSVARWGLDIVIPPDEYPWLSEVEYNISRHVVIVNDLFSWNKEVLLSQKCQGKLGGDLVNAVAITMQLEQVDASAAQARLAKMVQDLEENHFALLASRDRGKMAMSSDVERYIDFLEDMASGNESWSRVTARYYVGDGKQKRPTEENISFRSLELWK
ncbi:isoprenoid synthase domain-containing protein [Rhodocollybia butyracea]|uniref:Terpene synthase n=1 Tax=Rhodocollybia butyracea TaxID=206335 RepID=A0A9P5P830_9AGAR|nr:isoprenoid synthase domain-containing protein [Rhodocollybia butyracea]